MTRLSHEEILELQRAVVEAHLGGSRDPLLAGISPAFTASLPSARAPGEQVLTDLAALNSAGELADGSVPLKIWLKTAVQLCGGRREEKVFADALERLGEGQASAGAQTSASQGIARQAKAPAPAVHHHHGDTHMGNKYTITNTNSTIGAQGVGDGITVTGSLTIGAPVVPTQAQHVENIKAAKKALVDDEDQLTPLLHEVLGQFLRMARDIQVEQKNLAQVQALMKNTLDEVLAQQAAKGLRPQALPEGLKVVGELAKSPVMGEVVKKLLGA